jgi:hypothetical protein
MSFLYCYYLKFEINIAFIPSLGRGVQACVVAGRGFCVILNGSIYPFLPLPKGRNRTAPCFILLI